MRLETRQAYARWATAYDSTPNPMVHLVERALAQISGPPGRVLELGCGTGRNLAALADRGATELVGIDFSAEMLAVAAERVPQVTLLHHDVTERLPLPDDAFDLVVISLVLEHLSDVAPVFAEAARVLAPGGRLMVFELHPEAFAAGARAGFTDAEGEEIEMPSYAHDAGALSVVAAGAGLREGSFEHVRPDDALFERMPKLRRRGDVPWLLVGTWSVPGSSRLDLEAWPRRAAFAFFRTFDDPFFNLCADVDAGPALAWSRKHGASFFLVTLHAVLRAVHAVPELRYRLDGDGVVAHERVAVGATVLNPDESFSFVELEHHDRLADFLAHGEAVLEAHRRHGPTFEPRARTDVVYATVVPWVHFRSISHARSHRTGESVPKIAVGRYREEADSTSLPVSLEVHHALVDGLHVGRFFAQLERALATPDSLDR